MKITIVTTMRNEGRHLLEWVAYHRALGVTDFLVYTNDCEDDTEALLDLLPDVMRVSLGPGDKPPQWRALRAAWDHPLVQEADWMACIDCDEFINICSDLGGVVEIIQRADADAILLPWRLFGSSDQVDFGEGLSIVEFTKAAPSDMLYPALGSYFKTLFRRNGPFRQLGVHRPKQKNADRHGTPNWVDGSGMPVTGSLSENDGQIMNWGKPISSNLIQLNHYSVRSVSDYMIKRARGLPNHQSKAIDLTYWVERNFNTVEEVSIQHRLTETMRCIADFRKIAGVEELELASRRWARAKLEALLKEPEELALFGRLILAGASNVPSQKTALKLVRAYQVANG